MRSCVTLWLATGLTVARTPLAAQQLEANTSGIPADTADNIHVIRWYEVVAATGTVALLATLDPSVQRFTQKHRSPALDDAAAVFRKEGEPTYWATIGVGVLGVGLATRNGEVQRTGGRVLASVCLSGLATTGLKEVFGRSRPKDVDGAFEFHPFSSDPDATGADARLAMPSGHTTVAFAVATSLADDIDSPVADIILYTLAAGTGWSRINDNRHWFSDTVAGAMIGITSAKLVNGRWRIFNLRPPGFLVGPDGSAGVEWHVAF